MDHQRTDRSRVSQTQDEIRPEIYRNSVSFSLLTSKRFAIYIFTLNLLLLPFILAPVPLPLTFLDLILLI